MEFFEEIIEIQGIKCKRVTKGAYETMLTKQGYFNISKIYVDLGRIKRGDKIFLNIYDRHTGDLLLENLKCNVIESSEQHKVNIVKNLIETNEIMTRTYYKIEIFRIIEDI